jgi:hypothetical protein
MDVPWWPGPAVTLDQYRAFVGGLGLAEVRPAGFHPFFHEIVHVDQAEDPEEAISVVDTSWPCLMLGDMMFSRAGVRVRAGTRHARKQPAETSRLYWAHRRRNRPTTDQSDGWGSNSQWRTSFRRDCRIGDSFHYNIDARNTEDWVDLGSPVSSWPEGNRPDDDEGLNPKVTPQQRIELLTHRCAVISAGFEDSYPYADTLTTT